MWKIFALCFATAISACSFKEKTSVLEPFPFEANYVAVISDGDSFAQSYLGDELTPLHDSRYEDKLTLFLEKNKSSSVSVSNSVIGTPEIVAISPKGEIALVVETRI